MIGFCATTLLTYFYSRLWILIEKRLIFEKYFISLHIKQLLFLISHEKNFSNGFRRDCGIDGTC